MDVLQRNISDAITPSEKSADGIEHEESAAVRRLYKTTRYLHYVMKFVIRSRVLYAAMNCNNDYVDFAARLQELLKMFIDMIGCPSNLLKSEGALLKNLHIIATDLMEVFDQVHLRCVRENFHVNVEKYIYLYAYLQHFHCGDFGKVSATSPHPVENGLHQGLCGNEAVQLAQMPRHTVARVLQAHQGSSREQGGGMFCASQLMLCLCH